VKGDQKLIPSGKDRVLTVSKSEPQTKPNCIHDGGVDENKFFSPLIKNINHRDGFFLTAPEKQIKK
jgi:hypothetical protein